ncbi:MAG: AAA family ATPase [Candidatus Micrarchaeota archaeon]|nr:AAA family ATPase [Candidatus Micrarchaeota archaeon]
MKDNCIVLTGMPGVGKSTIGKILASALELEFIDLDLYIEYTEARKISEMLEEHGEEWVLKLESEKMRQIDLNNAVVSPGGSIVYDEQLMAQILRNATVIYLEDSLENIRLRMGNPNKRNIIWQGAKSLPELYGRRRLLYENFFDIKIQCQNKDESDIAKEAIKKFNEKCKLTVK